MELSILNEIMEKAKTRKDGVYSYRGHFYVVKNKQFIAYADPFGNCFSYLGGIFAIELGKVDRYDRKKELMKWLALKK